jgi:mannose-6-phosphate isomerase-like protein (cupin superfamily)
VRTARVVRPPSAERGVHDGELLFLFALSGGLRLHAGALEPLDLARGDAVAVPPGVPFGFEGSATGAELLEVALPAPT